MQSEMLEGANAIGSDKVQFLLKLQIEGVQGIIQKRHTET